MLLIYDGHKTHISLDLITKARNENISILKLPAHTTDAIQPLDKCCFRPLKAQWDKRLVEIQRMTGATRISKASFTELVDELWQTSLTPENIKSGFKSTGIYPLDRTKYPEKRFCSQMLASYKLQNSPSKRLAIASTSSASTNCSTTPSNNFSTLQLNLDTSGSQTEEHTPSICTPILSVSSFTTVGISKTSTIVSQSTASTSFEDLLSSQFRQTPKTVARSEVRRKIDTKAAVITNSDFLELVTERDREIKEKVNQKRKRQENTGIRKRKKHRSGPR